MYEACFGLRKRPFASVPRIDQYFRAASIENARQTLIRAIERAAGLGMIVGPSGTGKTLLCQLLAEQFRDRFEVAFLCSGHLGTRRALLQAVQYELGQPYRGMDESELRLALVDHLTLGDDCPSGLVLLVDEAHTLPLRLFEEIRMITNLVCGGQPRVRLVLAGGPLLEERLASPKLESFSQRLVARCYLEPLGRAETQQYIEAQVSTAGGRFEEIFAAEAADIVYQATGGVPRLVNQVCDHALLLACADGRQPVDAACVEEAWADLQQLPTPFSSDRQKPAASGVVEFGGLDDEPDDCEPTPSAFGEAEFGAAAELDFCAPSRPEPASEAAEAEPVDPDEMMIPRLRLAPESDDSATEPLEQLEQIKRALADIEEPFEPAGTIGPEVEVIFAGDLSPFDEEFQEEEILVESLSNVPRSPVAKPASEAVDPPGSVEHSPAAGTLPLADLREIRPTNQTPDDRPLNINRSGVLQQPAAEALPLCEAGADDNSGCNQPVPGQSNGPNVDAAEDDCESQPETVPLVRRAVAEATADDSDMIVVEDGYEDLRPPKAGSIIPVRRQEYRQLFARLRRG